jgi:protein-S-isoprenylcysteine O-methyltransferase Ste14
VNTSTSDRRLAASVRWGAVLFLLVYLGLALACLRQWGTPQPWSRLDVFSAGFLALLTLSAALELRIGQNVLTSGDAFREASGMTYDTATLILASALSVSDVLVFLDYGHWHLVPVLARPTLQSAGLALGGVALAWIAWTDAQLASHFGGAHSQRRVMTQGPFRYVRHPRYAGLLAARAAFALTLASAVGWLITGLWVLLLLRRIRLEEAHLRKVFGAEYEHYAARTRRLIPGIY